MNLSFFFVFLFTVFQRFSHFAGRPNDNNSNLPAAMALVHQETWVRFGTNGIGISDHQNRFSNGVRVANWVENEYGDNLKVRTFTALVHIAYLHATNAYAPFLPDSTARANARAVALARPYTPRQS